MVVIMTTEEALEICQGEMKDVVLNILAELGTDDDYLSLAEEIEAIFLDEYNILGKKSYPDFEDIALELIASM